ncbi:MAG: YkgJ family cysteine cluster protein [Pseudomonadota bacterium]
MTPLRKKLAKAKLKDTGAEAVTRARTQLASYADAQAMGDAALSRELHSGIAAARIGQIGLQTTAEPEGLACAAGCAFCCVLTGEDGGVMTGAEAKVLHGALAPLAGEPDGREWVAKACPALDPETRMCRAYSARPMICRSYISRDVAACESHANGVPAEGGGVRAAYGTYLNIHALGRAALGPGHAPTYSLRRVAAAAVEGRSLEEALKEARHRPAELHAERKRATL